MIDLKNKDVLVLGLDPFGQAAARLARDQGARVLVLDRADPQLAPARSALETLGVQVELGRKTLPSQPFDLAVLSPQFPRQSHLVTAAAQREMLLISELEFGFQHTRCLTIAISGQAGKSTTADLTERLLNASRRRTKIAGDARYPLSAAAAQTTGLDFITLKVTTAQLEHTRYFRPKIAVLLNLAPDLRAAHRPDHLRTAIGLFINQQVFDWAIIQAEALEQLRQLKLPIPGRILVFSAEDQKADIYLEGNWISSRIPGWIGPLVDLTLLNQASRPLMEDIMAALAVTHVLHIPLARSVPLVQQFEPAPHCGEWVAEIDGVVYINDAKSANLRALQRALAAIPLSPNTLPHVWLIAGGDEEGAQYHDLKLVVSRRVKGALLLGTSGQKMIAAWGLFTPCRPVHSLLEAISRAVAGAEAGDVILFSPGCSNSELFRDYTEGGDAFRRAVQNRKPARLNLIADPAGDTEAHPDLRPRLFADQIQAQAAHLYSPFTETTQARSDYNP